MLCAVWLVDLGYVVFCLLGFCCLCFDVDFVWCFADCGLLLWVLVLVIVLLVLFGGCLIVPL